MNERKSITKELIEIMRKSQIINQLNITPERRTHRSVLYGCRIKYGSRRYVVYPLPRKFRRQCVVHGLMQRCRRQVIY